MQKFFPIPLSVDDLMKKSREISGVDIVDHAIVEPLTVLHRSLCEESHLHREGAIAKQNKLLRLLSNRLRMQRDFARYPEIAEQEIIKPLLVMGMGRSGTTKMQKILAASGDFNWLSFWKAYNPALLTGSRDEDPQPRIDSADEFCRWFRAMSPAAKFGHPFETHEPEEDTILIEGSLESFSFGAYADIPSFLGWTAGRSSVPMFEFLRDSLKYLQWQGLANPAKRWLLKAPIYYGIEPDFVKVFPDAHIVFTHRSPLQTVPSADKLGRAFRTPFVDAPETTPTFLEGFAMAISQHLAVRRMRPDIKFLDLSFEEVTRSEAASLERIYAHMGTPLSPSALARMVQWSADNPMHKAGAFNYSLEEFGLTEARILAAMPDYFEFLTRLSQHVPPRSDLENAGHEQNVSA